MKSLSRIFTAGVVVGLAGSAFSQQALTQLWKVDAGGALTFFPVGSPNTSRGGKYNAATGNFLIAARSGGDVVRRVAGATGAEVAPNIPAAYSVAGATFALNKPLPTGTGVVYVANLAAVGNTFALYRHADETTGPTVAYSQTASVARIGDGATIIGSGNGTKILVTGSGSTVVVPFTTADGGLTFTRGTDITPGTPALVNIPSVAYDTDASSFWVRKTATSSSDLTQASLYAAAGGAATTSTAAIAGAGTIDVAQLGSRKVIASGPGATVAAEINLKAYIHDATVATPALYVSGNLEAGSSGLVNGNGSGNVSIDTVGNRLFVLATNNSISAWSIPNLTGVSDWNLY